MWFSSFKGTVQRCARTIVTPIRAARRFTTILLFITNAFLRNSGMKIRYRRLKSFVMYRLYTLCLFSQRRIPWQMTRDAPALSNNHGGRFVATRWTAYEMIYGFSFFFSSGLVYVFHSASRIPWLLNLPLAWQWMHYSARRLIKRVVKLKKLKVWNARIRNECSTDVTRLGSIYLGSNLRTKLR